MNGVIGCGGAHTRSAMTPFQRAVLEIIASAPQPVGWYNVETRLSITGSAFARERTPDVLEHFREAGLIERVAAEGMPRYVITDLGRHTLDSPS